MVALLGGVSAAVVVNVASVSATVKPAVAKAAASKSASAYSLAGVCPNPIVIQTDWDPAVGNDYELYQLAGANGTIDANGKSYTAPLIAHGHKTGVNIQLLAGGKVVGYQSGGSLMLEHSNILLAYDSTDTDIEVSSKAPVIDLVSDFANSALEIMWDPKVYPAVHTLKQLGKTNAVVLYSNGSPYMTYLVKTGVFRASQVSPSYTGSPAQYLAAGGVDAQQGYETAQQFPNLSNVPVAMQTLRSQPVSAYGYDPYQNAVATLPSYVSKYSACFKKLVPMIQQAGIDYYAKPAATNSLIVGLVTAYNDGWQYTLGDALYAAKQMKKVGIVKNGANGVFGEEAKTQIGQMIKVLTPILDAQGTPPAAGLTVSKLYTGQFIDQTIKMP